jgi:hypothetical protein
LANKPNGYFVRLADWTLVVSDFVPSRRDPRAVVMPGRAWDIAASVLRDAAHGVHEQGNPYDFRDVGYLSPPADPDIGIEVTDRGWETP